jgi:hypothetical protein
LELFDWTGTHSNVEVLLLVSGYTTFRTVGAGIEISLSSGRWLQENQCCKVTSNRDIFPHKLFYQYLFLAVERLEWFLKVCKGVGELFGYGISLGKYKLYFKGIYSGFKEKLIFP